MGQQLHQRATRTLRRVALVAVLGAVVLVSGCSAQTEHEWKNLAMPDPATEQGEHIFYLWRWAWVAALVTGAIVWGLIFFVVVRYRRRSDDEVPVQTRYNLPLEIFYTIAPIIMVIVFFYHTVNVQNAVLRNDPPDHVVNVVGQQWSWTFNYTGEDAVTANNIYTSGTQEADRRPTLVLPVGETTRFNLYSPDVIHDFGIPAFLMRMDVIPGRVNHYEVTPTAVGDYRGKCYELCGTYHSRMLFDVKVVTPEEFDTYLKQQETAGYTSDKPLLGGSDAYTQSGLNHEGGQE